jgi:hypothetical protein
MVVGGIVLLAVIRKRDVEAIDPEAQHAVAGA